MAESQAFDRETLRESIASFPLLPGVYIMRNREDTILYVGKAKQLRNRVRSYFSHSGQHIKTAVLMKHVRRIEYIVTSTEHEALLLENSLIKQHQPRYNINLKDSKSYPVIRITNEDFPRVFRTRRIVQDGSEYFGPFPNVHAIDLYLELIEKLYPLRKCRGAVRNRPKPCLYYHIGRCAGVCAGKTDKSAYADRVAQIRRLLNGDTAMVSRELQHRMENAAQELRFEEAAWCRDVLNAVDELNSRQSVVDFDPETRDYIALHRNNELCVFTVFQMRGGKLLGSESFRSRSVEDDRDAVAEFLGRYYTTLKQPPRRIFCQMLLDSGIATELLMPARPDDATYAPDTAEAAASPAANDADAYAANDAAEPGPAYGPQPGQLSPPLSPELLIPTAKRDSAIMNMATENARQELATWMRSEGDIQALQELAAVLDLPAPPLRIEGFDIAQLHGKHTVAAMVSFSRGAPDKSRYRRYHIRTTAGKIDDYAAMREVVARRYTRLANEELPMPDLILIDGGRGQVNAARQVLRALDLERIPVVGLAKQFEELILPEQPEPLRLPDGSPPLRILQYVRDEAHRFSTGFNQLLRGKDIGLNILESVDGIGPQKSQKLLKTFGSLRGIAAAEPADLQNCVGIRESAALQLKLLAGEAVEHTEATSDDTQTGS
ncbi:excinuclease ABC subunit UvrC [Spirochaeta africana]|uniref:UvrABC system protein C n=1 Tax=Spirochaeta africana (strain ATCC 700263 / DSM 8902 / Z-7692) TaxID=889378 RepID=H9UME5_SPIAZ|nr:excinuclease ABC subunit UvrC [Spirochaeta africana]AFG38688.1 excinuclease ABC, C subunit [Spirochaeta africana DSM 8902]